MSGMKKLVQAKHVSAIITDAYGDTIDVIENIKTDNNKIWMCFPDNTTVFTAYHRLTAKNISVSYVREDGKYDNASVILSNSEYIKQFIYNFFHNGKLKTGDINFCDVLVLGGVSLWGANEMMIMNLWDVIMKAKNEVKMPRLVLSMFNTEVNKEIPFDISDSYYCHKSAKVSTIHYHNAPMKGEDIIETMYTEIFRAHKTEALEKTFLVYCPGFEEVVWLSAKLRQLNVRLFYLTKELDQKNANKLNLLTHITERVIIVSCPALTPIDNISIVFDSTLHYTKHNKNQLTHVSKMISNQRTIIANDYCYRFCTSDEYDLFNTQESSGMSSIKITRTVMEVIDKGLDPVKVLANSLTPRYVNDEIMDSVEKKMISVVDGKFELTPLGSLFLKLKMTMRSTILIQEWATRYSELFPIIVLASIIDGSEDSFLHLSDDEDHLKRFESWISGSTLEMYLKAWCDYASEIRTLKPNQMRGESEYRSQTDNSVLKKWCVSKSVNFMIFNNILERIVDTYDALEYYFMHSITIGLFSYENLISMSNDIMKIAYSSDVYQLTDSSTLTYTNTDYEVSTLDTSRHLNASFKLPFRLISLHQENGIITLFHPIGDRVVNVERQDEERASSPMVEQRAVQSRHDMFPVYGSQGQTSNRGEDPPDTPVFQRMIRNMYNTKDDEEYNPTLWVERINIKDTVKKGDIKLGPDRTVVEVDANGPLSDIQEGDTIISIGNKETDHSTLDDIETLLISASGTHDKNYLEVVRQSHDIGHEEELELELIT